MSLGQQPTNSTTALDDETCLSCIGILVLKLSLILGLVMCIAVAVKLSDARQQKTKARGMLSDQDDDKGASCGIEMAELPEDGLHSGDAPADGMEGVRLELARLRLDRYADAFEEHGYDLWAEIVRLPDHRLAKLVELVGMTANHVDRFREQLHLQRRSQGLTASAQPRTSVAADGGADEHCSIL